MDKHIDGDDAVNAEGSAISDDAVTTEHDRTPEQHDAGRDSLADLDSPGHVFDQTNGLADGLEGESDGTAEGAGEGGDADTR